MYTEDGDTLYNRVLQVFVVLSLFLGLCLVNILRHQSLQSSAILVGLVNCQSCEFCNILKMEEEGEQKELEMEDVLVVEEDIMVKFHLFPFPLVYFLCSSNFKVLPTKKKLKNNFYRNVLDPT